MMPTQTWTLVDHDQDLYVDQIALGPEQVGGAAEGYSVVKRTLRAGLSQGVDVIEVRHGDFRFVVVPTRGMGIWRACLGDLHLGWKSPVRGPVHPAYVRAEHPDGIGWLDGFDELLVRCGLESNGAPEFQPDGRLRYGLHGKIANLPAHKVEVAIDGDSGRIAIRGTVDETRLFGSKLRLETSIETQVGRPGLVVYDKVTNLSAAAIDFELLYHINFGVPFLQPGGKVLLPVKKLAPRDSVTAADLPSWNLYGPETPGSTEVCFFLEPASDADGNTQALLHNPGATQGVSLKFNTRQLPCFSIWKNREAAQDGYVTGLEPATNFPNVKSFEKQMGRVVELGPGQSRNFVVELEPLVDAAHVQAATAAIARLQQSTPAEILAQPDPRWSTSK
ncbi:MAG: aldose 1-epimerase family protein [Planctomycetota bacterium]